MGYTNQWKEILDKVMDFSDKRNVSWFRGHSSSEYKLLSGLYRQESLTNTEKLKREAAMYHMFSTIGSLDVSMYQGYELLYLMQHHGVKTRLLDWTESFNTALFFAFVHWNPYNDNPARIWMLDPCQLNVVSIGENLLKLPQYMPNPYLNFTDTNIENGTVLPYQSTIALYPTRNNKRIIAQQGVFTMQGASDLPIEEEFKDTLIKDGDLCYIDLDIDVYDDVHNFLLASGVTYHTLFPDLDGLAKYTNDPYLSKPDVFKEKFEPVNVKVGTP